MRGAMAEKEPGRGLFEWLQTLMTAVVCMVLLFTFVGRVVRVDGRSMDPTLAHGELLLASPVNVLLRLGQLAVTAAFWRTVAWSALRIFGGFLISTVLAVVLAALAAWKTWFRGLMAPLVAAVKTVPVASFIILALVWLNSQSLSLFISALMVFPPVYLNVLEGICRTDRRLLEMARVFRLPLGRRVKAIWLPAVLPAFRQGCSVALGICWKSGVAAEVIGLPDGSIGDALYRAKITLSTGELFAWTFVIIVLSAAFEKLFLALLDKAVARVLGEEAV